MILIADSGSTKTDWAFVEHGEIAVRHVTQGLNPVHIGQDEICDVISRMVNETGTMPVTAVYFYGAGCIPIYINKVENALRQNFPGAEVCVESDLLGAARSLFCHGQGIACILGTGSNACLYDGERIVDNVPPMGYILGDEGSGACLGRLFLNLLFKRRLSEELKEEFSREFGLTYPDVIRKVYHEPGANRFLASLCPFIRRHMASSDHPAPVGSDADTLSFFVQQAFEDFFNRNVRHYDRSYPLGFIGSVAHHFRDFLQPVATGIMGYTLQAIERSPMDGLVRYHG